MRSTLATGLLLAAMPLVATTQSAVAESYPSTPTVLRTKTIYARAEGEVTKLNLAPGQVFLWDEFAASIAPSKSPRAEFGRAYADFAGAVSKVLVQEGQMVNKGDPLYECRFLERVYTTCVVPDASVDARGAVDRTIKATWRGETFEAKVLDASSDGRTTVLYVVIYNHHEHRYWHLTHDQVVTLHF